MQTVFDELNDALARADIELDVATALGTMRRARLERDRVAEQYAERKLNEALDAFAALR